MSAGKKIVVALGGGKSGPCSNEHAAGAEDRDVGAPGAGALSSLS
jgi:hypothetical protein